MSGSVVRLRPGEERAPAAPFFVDWLSINQVHYERTLPLVDAGCVWAADENGEVQWRTVRAVRHEGSFETALNVRCDGNRVSFTGNVSRFCRQDNLFGFDVFECMRKVNEVLAHYGLPPFDAGRPIHVDRDGQTEIRWTGARISRIDLTANYEAGSAEDAHAVLQWLGAQHASRQEGRVLGQGETVAWGSGSRRQYWKAYIKHLEMRRHDGADERVIEHCATHGVVRFEGTIRSNTLTEIGAAFWADYERGYAMGQLIRLFNDHAGIMSRAEHQTDDFDHLPTHLRATARDYLAGMDCRATLKRATFFRHRRELLGHGIDIAVRNVRPFTPRVRVVELRPAVVPEWYSFESRAA